MPKNTRAIGKKNELRAVEFYQKYNCQAWKPSPRAIWIGPGRVVSQSQDILEVFDVIAYRKDRGFYFSQVTTLDKGPDSAPTQKKRKVESGDFDYRHAIISVMAWEKGKEWHFWVLGPKGWTRLTEDEYVQLYLNQVSSN